MWKQALQSRVSYRTGEALKTAIALALYWSGAAFLLSLVRGRGAVILMYHSVGGENVFADNVVSLARFAEQIAFLRRRRTLVPLARIVERLERGEALPRDWLAITFDDGYRDNRSLALPVLRAHEAVASFFVTCNVLGGGEPFFYDRIEAIVSRCTRDELVASVDGRAQRFSLRTERDRREATLRLVLAIRERPEAERRAFVEALAKDCGVEEERAVDGPYLDEDDLRALAGSGMEIGSHTLGHPDLTGLDDATLHEELLASRQRLEAAIDAPVHGLAYPFGRSRHFDRRVQDVARRAGYRYALTTESGFVRATSDAFALPRIGVRDAPLARLKAALLGVFP